MIALEPRELLTLLGQQLFPSDNPWNQNIASAPVASNSAAIISNIISLYGDGRFHPDFGQDTQSSNPLYGIPFNIVHGNTQPKVHVVVDGYPDESDLKDAPIPANAVLEGDNQNGPVVGLDNRGDSHLIVWDEDNNVAYEFYNASRPSENTDGQWHAAQESVWDMKTDTFRTLGWTSADAAGLAILPGLVRPDEALPVSQGGQGVINHAIRITLKNNIILDQFLYPASHIANSGNNPAVQPPMGARLRLKASVDISTPQPRVARHRPGHEGLRRDRRRQRQQLLRQRGKLLGRRQQQLRPHLERQRHPGLDPRPEEPDLQRLRGGRHDAGRHRPEPLVRLGGLDRHHHRPELLRGSRPSPGSLRQHGGDERHRRGRLACHGRRAGRDGHGRRARAVGSHRLRHAEHQEPDLRLRHSPPSPRPTGSPTAGPPGNQPPTVAQPASATPNPVTATTTTLSVLGADDAGEANLIYTWQATAEPSGASPAFSANGTNAAKNTVVTFNRAGAYTFQVTITDSGGLTVDQQRERHGQPDAHQHRRHSLDRDAAGSGQAAVHRHRRSTSSARPWRPSRAFTWSKFSGRGSISKTGLYTAPSSGTGTAVIQAKAGGKAGQATITFGASGNVLLLSSKSKKAFAAHPRHRHRFA